MDYVHDYGHSEDSEGFGDFEAKHVCSKLRKTFSDRGGTDGLWSALSGLLIELSIPASGLSDFKNILQREVFAKKCISKCIL